MNNTTNPIYLVKRHSFPRWKKHQVQPGPLHVVSRRCEKPPKDACMTEGDTAKKSILIKNKNNKFSHELTPIVASQRVRKGVCTVAVMCPAAATIRLIALRTSGCEVKISDKDVGSEGASNEGKSGVPLVQELEDSGGTKCEVFTIEGDGGGEA